MFTGIIEETGKIKSVRPLGGGIRISITGSKVTEDLKIDDSIAINGVCQTVVSIDGKVFDVEAIEQTLRKTTLRDIKPGTVVNLERALSVNGRLGGHIVQGHIDTIGRIGSIAKEKTGINISITYPTEFRKWVVPQGSICIDGVSLTVAHSDANSFTVSIIPHTWSHTALNGKTASSEVNLEFDIIGKYVENLLAPFKGNRPAENSKSSLEQYIDQPSY